MIRVLVVDDEAMVRAGLRLIVRSEPDMEVVGEAADGEQAIASTARFRPDVVLMDVRMPRMDGIEATRRLIELDSSQPRVLMLTTFDLDEYVYGALRAGASGFLLKSAPPERLVEAVRVVAAGEALLAPSVTRRVIEEFARAKPRGALPAEFGELTDRERQVLTLLARGRSNDEIAAELIVSRGTVKTHVGRVLSKLGLRDRVQAVVYAYENRLITPGGNQEAPT